MPFAHNPVKKEITLGKPVLVTGFNRKSQTVILQSPGSSEETVPAEEFIQDFVKESFDLTRF